MSRILSSKSLPNYYALPAKHAQAADSERIEMKTAFGQRVSLGVATCQPGYHPAPQMHDSEQLNYVADGEIWVYIEGQAFHLKKGDAIRVPKLKVHWMWNRSDRPCTFYESNCPPLAGAPEIYGSGAALFDADDVRPPNDLPEIVWLSESYARETEERVGDITSTSGLYAAEATLERSVHGGAIGKAAEGKLTSICITGLEHNMTIGTRKGSYHSAPHVHACEQVHINIKGGSTIHTARQAFHIREGDFNIVFKNEPHWAEIGEGDDRIALQAYSPVLGSAKNRKALLTDEERVAPVFTVFNMMPWRPERIVEVEAEHNANPRLAESA